MISKFSYSEAVRKLLARDVLKSRNSPYQEKEKTVNPVVESSSALQNSTKSLEFKFVDTLRMSKRKKVKYSVETLV